MNGEVEGMRLLDAAQNELQTYIIPGLSGGSRYRALLVAKAIRMVTRELAQNSLRHAAATGVAEIAKRVLKVEDIEEGGVVAAIRSYKLSADADFHRALWALAVIDVSITKPSALNRIERRMAGLDDFADNLPI